MTSGAQQREGRLVGVHQARQLAQHQPDDVLRTRIYLSNVQGWEPVAHEHGRVFAEIRPVNTTVQAVALIGGEYLVEIEPRRLRVNR